MTIDSLWTVAPIVKLGVNLTIHLFIRHKMSIVIARFPELRPPQYTNLYTNAARSRPRAITYNCEHDIQHSRYLSGFLPSDCVRRRTTRNKLCGIPLNGVSRVRIPPPPLQESPTCSINGKLTIKAGTPSSLTTPTDTPTQ